MTYSVKYLIGIRNNVPNSLEGIIILVHADSKWPLHYPCDGPWNAILGSVLLPLGAFIG